MKIRLIILSIFLTISSTAFSQFYTGSNMSFGRKRVQYESFFWFYYRFNNFDVYYNRNGKNLALYTASYIQNNLSDIEERVGKPLDKAMKFIIYNRLTDYKQSNIGYIDEENYNSGGVTKIQGNKAFLFFNGDYVDFERQIREAVVEILIKQLIYGQNISSQIRSETMMTSVPQWFEYGAISYFANDWNNELDEDMRDAVLSKKYKYLTMLEGDNAKKAGHSFFRFISKSYGEDAVLRLLRNTAKRRNVDAAIKHSLNQKFKDLVKKWQVFCKNESELLEAADKPNLNLALKKIKQKDREYYQFRLSPDADKVAYISNEKGKTIVHLRDLKTDKHRILMKIGFALDDKTDYSYPALAWHPSGELLAIAAEKKGITNLYLYNIKEKKYIWLNMESFDKILSLNYSHDGSKIVMSAVKDGYSDLFVYNLNTHISQQLTFDIYDDANPQFVDNGEKIIFSSNRPLDTLLTKEKFQKAPILNPNHNIFIFENGKTELYRMTDDSLTNFTFPTLYDENSYSFLNDEKGITNRSLAKVDSAIASVDTIVHYNYLTNYQTITNESRSLREQDINPITQQVTSIQKYKNKNLLTIEEGLESEEVYVSETNFYRENKENQRKLSESKDENQEQPAKRKLRHATWDDAVEEMSTESTTLTLKNRLEEFRKDTVNFVQDSINLFDADSVAAMHHQAKSRFFTLLGLGGIEDTVVYTSNPRQRIYNVEFAINELTTQMSFSFMNNSYQQFTGSDSPLYLSAGYAAFLKIAASDLMENHRLIAGVRLGFNLSDNEMLLSYENLEHRLGYQFVAHRSAQTAYSYEGYKLKFEGYNVYGVLKYPFSEVFMLKGTVFGKFDRMIVKSMDNFSSTYPNENNFFAGLKVELIYDHSRPLMKNINKGARAKIFGEFYQSLTDKNNAIFVVGADYRHYWRLWRYLTWANRLAGSSSFGHSKLIYYMGGVDDWLFAKFDKNIPVDPNQNWQFQTLATNMRGFPQNIRNGNNFIAINSELRFPIVACLSPKPLSAWLQNIQIVGFFDCGTAWTGWNPWNKKNLIYHDIRQYGNLTVDIEKELEPIVAGMGVGLRMELFGYFIRLDRAWGLENGHFNNGAWHFSIGMDF